MLEIVKELFSSAFRVDSFTSIVLRGAIWFVIAVVIIISADAVDPDKASRNLKANLGFTLMFMLLTGSLIYLLFGFTKTA